MKTSAKYMNAFAVLLFASATQAMDTFENEFRPDAPQSMKKLFEGGKNVFFAVKDKVKDGASTAMVILKDKFNELTVEAKASEVAASAPVEQMTKQSTQQQPTTSKTKNKWFNLNVHRPKQAELMKFGAGVFVIAVIGGITYVLYENGTLKVFSDKAQEHPYITASIAGSAVALLATVYTCYKYQVNPFSMKYFAKNNVAKPAIA